MSGLDIKSSLEEEVGKGNFAFCQESWQRSIQIVNPPSFQISLMFIYIKMFLSKCLLFRLSFFYFFYLVSHLASYFVFYF